MATVGPEKITEQELQEKLAELGPAASSYLATKPGRRQFLDLVIRERLMLTAARKSDIFSSKEYKSQVEQKKKDLNSMLESYKEYLLSKMWLQKMRETEFKVTDAEADEYYQKYPYIMTMGHILLPDNDKEAEAVYRRLRAGADFDTIAKQYSVDKDTIYLPPIMHGEFLPELDDMILKMRVGETQGIVRTALGLHIIKKLKQEKADEKAVMPRIKSIIEKRKFDKFLEKCQETMKVEVLDEKYK